LNPYREWLGIQTDDRPGSHYELLGLPKFEADLQQIRAAYDARRSQVSRCVTTEQEGALATGLLRELSVALACLSDPQAKATYDAQLRMAVSPTGKQPPTPVRSVPASASVAAGRVAGKRPSARSFPIELIKIVVGGVVGLAIASVLLFVLGVNPWSGSQPAPPRPTVAQGERNAGIDAATSPAGETSGPDATGGDPFRPQRPADVPDDREVSEFDRAFGAATPPAAGSAADASKRVTWAPDYSLQEVTNRSEQLVATCRQVQPMLTNPGALSDADKKALSIEFIRTLQLFAEELTFCTATEEELSRVMSSVADAVASITDTESKQRVLSAIARSICKAGDRARHGVLLLGVVDDIQLVDGLYKTTLRHQDATGNTISLWSWQDPAQECQLGAVVISFAVLVEAPAEYLSGYTGSEPTVAWTRRVQTIGP